MAETLHNNPHTPTTVLASWMVAAIVMSDMDTMYCTADHIHPVPVDSDAAEAAECGEHFQWKE
jgi:hypothetical protein